MHGENFLASNELTCRFWGVQDNSFNHVIPGLFISRELMSCTQPSMAVGDYYVQISNNKLEYSNTGITSRYIVHPSIFPSKVEPLTGTYLGGTNVTIFGSGFTYSEELACRFGDIAVPAK